MSDEPTPQPTESNNKPIDKFFDRGVSLSVFEKEYITEDGKKKTFYSYSPQRAYTDKKTGETAYGTSLVEMIC